jgi:hypothetical protein
MRAMLKTTLVEQVAHLWKLSRLVFNLLSGWMIWVILSVGERRI